MQGGMFYLCLQELRTSCFCFTHSHEHAGALLEGAAAAEEAGHEHDGADRHQGDSRAADQRVIGVDAGDVQQLEHVVVDQRPDSDAQHDCTHDLRVRRLAST